MISYSCNRITVNNYEDRLTLPYTFIDDVITTL